MAKPELLQAILVLSKRVDTLLDNELRLIEKIKSLENENQQLRLMQKQQAEELEKSKKDIEFLSMSHRLADSPEALISARKKISKLIRTIDSCIRLIKED